METNVNGVYTGKLSRGFSLIEVMVTLTVASIFAALLFTYFPSLQRTGSRFLEQTAFEEDLLIFLNLFNRDFLLTELPSNNRAGFLGQMKFRQDLNDDGDYLDPSESIQYRWNPDKKRIDRKSGSGNYQSLVEGVASFSWSSLDPMNNCYQMKFTSVTVPAFRTVTFCRRD